MLFALIGVCASASSLGTDSAAFAGSPEMLDPPAHLLPEEVPFYSPPESTLNWRSRVDPGFAEAAQRDPHYLRCFLIVDEGMIRHEWNDPAAAYEFVVDVLRTTCSDYVDRAVAMLYVLSCHMTPGYPAICDVFQKAEAQKQEEIRQAQLARAADAEKEARVSLELSAEDLSLLQ